ncbi:ricin-type beta-trefoil lectin domain protein (plasmid) [Streptomyces sp. NBC_01527]|uniref:RICIN domain-containing protein n=1 Tax=unclassified Streptomyces TaxID=2593676 RepID=UPI002E0E8E73|nr:ricin-type beta-trefoil lectin domain protein [Streptomyces sp. NBC_01230]
MTRAGTMVPARSGEEPAEGQTERNVRLVGVMAAVAVLAALGLGTVAFMTTPGEDAPHTRAVRIEDGAMPTAGTVVGVLPSSSSSPTSPTDPHHKDGAPHVNVKAAAGDGLKADGASPAAEARSSHAASSSSGGKTVAETHKADTPDADKNPTHSTPAATTHTQAPGSMIVGYGSSRCVGVSAHKGTDGSPLVLQGCAGDAWQKWVFASDGSVRSMGMCLDIANASSDNGVAIQLTRCNGGWAQKFNLNSSHDLVNTRIGKCVDAKDMGTAAGTRLQLWECGGTSNQKWHLG